MPISAKPTFDAGAASTFSAAKIVSVKMLNDTHRLEIRLADTAGVEHVISLPLLAAVELAQLTLDASHFMTRLKYGPAPSRGGRHRGDEATGS
jgi:hypothetical protein